MTRAVVFDLWDTLVDFPLERWRSGQADIAARLGLEPDDFLERWNATRHDREIATVAESLRGFGADDAAIAAVVEQRRTMTRAALVPRPGAVETLRELRDRGKRLGMISVCTDEVPELWPDTPFADLFDSTIFSCSVGLRKPDPRIYLLACDELGVEPHEAMFVGDGANDELAGAQRVGMRAVLIHRDGAEPYWPEVRAWSGPRITAIPQVLDLL